MLKLDINLKTIAFETFMDKYFNDTELKNIELQKLTFNNTAITTADANCAAFAINPPGWNYDQDFPINKLSKQYVLRIALNYMAVTNFNSNVSSTLNVLNTLYQSLLHMQSTVDLQAAKLVTFKRPDKTYLRNLDDHAGYELRLYVQT